MNILVTTLGQTWPIVPELIGLTNPLSVKLFEQYPNASLLSDFRNEVKPVDEVWLILTDNDNSKGTLQIISQWSEMIENKDFVIREFICPGTSNLVDVDECRKMTDYIYRVVLLASESVQNGKLYLSLAGGRKTMSADMQKAAWLFGCDALFHVADNIYGSASILGKKDVVPCQLSGIIPAADIEPIFPVIIERNRITDQLVSIPTPVLSRNFPVDSAGGGLLRLIEEREKQAQSLVFNNYLERGIKNNTSYFHGLQLLPAYLIDRLQTERIGIDPKLKEKELTWLKKLPKADLHCHLGGVLDARGMVDTALSNHEAINLEYQLNKEFKAWIDELELRINNRDSNYFEELSKNGWRNIEHCVPSVDTHLLITGFLAAFKSCPDFLDMIIFGDLIKESEFCKIDINRYMSLGDLQGSALLRKECCLRKCLQILKEKSSSDEVTYCEVRCSPVNYVADKMDIEKVLEIIKNELENCVKTKFKIIIIASRHGHMDKIRQHIKLVTDHKNDPDFNTWFAGFDLAGDEKKVSPAELLQEFKPLLEECINITIHAGETDKVENVWQAAYVLNSDRIGHGLKLNDNPRLAQRFADRRISVELCPSSNYQIVGFRDNYFPEISDMPVYPLMNYFEKGIQVSINTDNPGISRTTLSNEYLKAARLSSKGLTKWEVLQLVRNSFKAAFCPKSERKQLLLDAEKDILNLIMSENGFNTNN